jgi:putative flippase GtrA
LINLAGLGPFLARLIAILVAMVIAWLMHRRITFDVPDPPSIGEFLRFAGVAWTAAAVNYLVYAAILIVLPGTPPLAAMTVSSIVAAVVSYTGFRIGVFRR